MDIKLRNRLLAVLLLFTPVACMAQEASISSATLKKQKNMAKWEVPPGNYSGITPIEGNRYAIVNDKDKGDGFYLFDIAIDSIKGKIRDVSLIARPQISDSHGSVADVEDLAFVPASKTVFIADEGMQKIREYQLNGQHTGRELHIPAALSVDSIYCNYGFESLTYSSKDHLLWTITEQSLRKDGKKANSSLPVSCLLRLYAFSPETCEPVAYHYYKTDKPAVKKRGRHYAFGVSAITALEDGTLLVMEREFYASKKYLGSWANVKIYRVDLRKKSADGCLEKELVIAFKNRLNLFHRNLANYEGMCLGPKLSDGRQTIILLADSQNNCGNRLFHLKDHIRMLLLSWKD